MLLRASLLLNVSSDAPRNAGSRQSSSRLEAQAAFFTLPARIHAVQTRTCFLTPATTARTRFRFGFHRRRRVLFAWLITFPKCGALPQNSHLSAIFLPASVFIWAWISCSKCRQTKLLILADPPPPAKRVFAARMSLQDAPLAFLLDLRGAPLRAERLNWTGLSHSVCLQPECSYGTTCMTACLWSLPSGTCSFVRDSNARRVPVTPPIVLKPQGLPAKRSTSGRPYHC